MRTLMANNLPDLTQPNFNELALRWFGDESAAPALGVALQHVKDYFLDSAKYGSPAQRTRKLDAVGSASHRLLNHLADLDLTTALRLFGGQPPQAAKAAEQVINASMNGNASRKHAEFQTLLREIVVAADRLILTVPPQSPGAKETSDAIVYGVQCLASFWKKFRNDDPTSSRKANCFGAFAEDLLTASPVNAPASQVRTAVRRLIEDLRAAAGSPARIDNAGS